MNSHSLIQQLWRASRPLTAVGLGMLALFAVTTIGLVSDPRLVGGAPVWLKPAKFAISTGIYALTFAWIFTYLDAWPRLRRVVGWTTAFVLVLEVALIDLQAARGITSHFNVGTPLDAAIFGVMGTAILAAWAVSIALTVAVFRQRFTDGTLGWAIRLGLLITVLGSATGGLMTRPAEGQLAGSDRPAIVGAHTVGAPDGGPGLPVTGWSLEHGDLRVAHFLGLHAVQILPAVAWLTRRMGSAHRRRRSVLLAATSYASLFALALGQALAGQALVAPKGPMAVALVLWLVATLTGIASVAGIHRRNGKPLSANAMVLR